MNMEDYLGILADIPGMAVEEAFGAHTCDFCQHAKRQGFRDCFANKRAVNRLLQRRRRPIQGLCHLGLTDLVHPVVVDGVCVAGLFYGSIVVAGTEEEGRQRILAYCRRKGRPAEPYLARHRAVPVVQPHELAGYRERLALAAEIITRLIEASGLPLSRYRQEPDAQTVRERAGWPLVLQAAVRMIDRAYPQRLDRRAVAQHVRCNPNYLSGLFTRHLGIGFREYLNRVRLGRAQRLLRHTGLGIGEIAFAVGFEEASYFNRRFREATGQTPTEFRKQRSVARAGSAE